MKKSVLSFFSVLLTICCNAQTELSLKNISIEFPDKYSSKEFQGSSVYVVSKDSVTYQLLFNPKTTLVVTSEAKLKEYLNATTKGYLESIGTDFKGKLLIQLLIMQRAIIFMFLSPRSNTNLEKDILF